MQSCMCLQRSFGVGICDDDCDCSFWILTCRVSSKLHVWGLCVSGLLNESVYGLEVFAAVGL